jgi:hypothetical protein
LIEKKTGLDLMRQPFLAHQISKLPKPTANKEIMDKLPKGNCSVCGGYHATSKVNHLDYVGHAALTDRLLDCDPLWSWEPVAFKDGLPAFDATGGLWIRLTVCGRSMLGYGHAAGSQYKDIGAREKEVIGDGLRNAAMRMGAALELWHKGDLHLDEKEEAISGLEIELASATEIAAIRQALIIRGKDENAALKHWKITSMNDMPKAWVDGILNDLKPKVNQSETV